MTRNSKTSFKYKKKSTVHFIKTDMPSLCPHVKGRHTASRVQAIWKKGNSDSVHVHEKGEKAAARESLYDYHSAVIPFL